MESSLPAVLSTSVPLAEPAAHGWRISTSESGSQVFDELNTAADAKCFVVSAQVLTLIKLNASWWLNLRKSENLKPCLKYLKIMPCQFLPRPTTLLYPMSSLSKEWPMSMEIPKHRLEQPDIKQLRAPKTQAWLQNKTRGRLRLCLAKAKTQAAQGTTATADHLCITKVAPRKCKWRLCRWPTHENAS